MVAEERAARPDALAQAPRQPRLGTTAALLLVSEKRKLILRKQTPAYTQAEHTQRTAKA